MALIFTLENVILAQQNKTDSIHIALKDPSLRRIGVGLNMPVTLYDIILAAAFESDMSVHDYVINHMATHLNWGEIKNKATTPGKVTSG